MKFFGNKSKDIKEFQPEKKNEKKPIDISQAPPMKLPEIKKPLPPPPPRPMMRETSSSSPPLFIKVDKYKNIVKDIRDLKSHILNMRDALDVLGDMQKEVTNGIGIAHKTIDELNTIIANLDSYFLRPQAMDHHMDEDFPRDRRMHESEVEGQMKDVYGQVEKLRAQLRAIR